jgi:predicted alpha/beta superfamily hydrolase
MDSNTTLPEAILVGIPNSSARLAEYGLGADILRLEPSPYLRFLKEVVKPRIDQEFRTRRSRKYTAVMGSSMGGIVSITTGYVYPETFGVVAALSPAFQVPDVRGHTLLDVVKKHGRGRFRLYVDNGTAGETQDGAPLTREFVKLARKKGWKDGVGFEHFEDIGAAHNERAWRARAWRPLKFILQPMTK